MKYGRGNTPGSTMRDDLHFALYVLKLKEIAIQVLREEIVRKLHSPNHMSLRDN